jgi:hypothetical protein
LTALEEVSALRVTGVTIKGACAVVLIAALRRSTGVRRSLASAPEKVLAAGRKTIRQVKRAGAAVEIAALLRAAGI